MKIKISEKQFKMIQENLNEQETADASTTQQTTTSATKWESGVTRGPANQIGNTKWSDTVGSTLKRGKANPLK